MDDAELHPSLFGAVFDLQKASRISSGHDGCARGFDVAQLALEEVVGHFGLDEIVDACAAAAPGAFGQFDQVQSGNGFKKLAGLSRNFLAVAEVAGFVVGDGRVRCPPFSRDDAIAGDFVRTFARTCMFTKW